MELPRRQFLHLATGAAALPALSRIARAQTYPSRPITVIVPYAAGGGTDVTARLVAQRMRAPLGQPVVVENVTGAGGSIGAGRVARAAPDGYTISLGQIGSHVLPGAMYPLQYDLLNDFEPIALLATDPLLVLAKSGISAGDLQGLIAWLKANPDKAAMGHSGFGGMSHVAGVLFQKESGTRFRLVPYRGAAPALQDLAAGHIDLQITDAATSLPGVRAGLVKALAITANARLSSLPNVPTVDEAGLPGFYVSIWFALWAPRGTSKDIIAKLNAAAVEALGDPGVRTRLADLDQVIVPREQQTPEALRAFQKAEVEKWWPIIKGAGIKAE
jgi:tripartite-type tricarboxylate transporter receptor subunit TctC